MVGSFGTHDTTLHWGTGDPGQADMVTAMKGMTNYLGPNGGGAREREEGRLETVIPPEEGYGVPL